MSYIFLKLAGLFFLMIGVFSLQCYPPVLIIIIVVIIILIRLIILTVGRV